MKHNKLIYLFLVSILVMSMFSVTALAANTTDLTVKVNGKIVTFPDDKPVIESGRTLVPVRFVAEALGYDVDWEDKTRTAVIDGGRIRLIINSKTAVIQDISVALEVPARIIGDRTYVPLRFLSENLNCTVDWFAANRSIIINALLPDGKEVSLYDRCKQSGLFYEKLAKSLKYKVDPNWESQLYLKSCLSTLTDEACLDANWYIARFYTTYPNSFARENGADIRIGLFTPTLQSRREIKTLFMTFYPTGYTQAYDLLMKTIREELFENQGTAASTISGTYGIHYYDNREVSMWRNMSSLATTIHIKDAGYVNPQKPILPSAKDLEWAINNGASRRESSKVYMEKYELDTW